MSAQLTRGAIRAIHSNSHGGTARLQVGRLTRPLLYVTHHNAVLTADLIVPCPMCCRSCDSSQEIATGACSSVAWCLNQP